jgi:two-component system nitrogen regulation response regulator GlnG
VEPGETPPTEGLGAGAKPPRRLRLEVTAGPDRGAALELASGTYFVGKGSGCDLVLRDGSVSRRHLEVAVLADRARVRDLDSTNGSFFQGARFSSLELGPGAQIRVGRTELRLVEPLPRAAGDPPPTRFGRLESVIPAMQQVFSVLARVAATDSVVLVQGATGTGKDLVAEAVHAASPRRHGPFVICDLASLPRGVIESELFGHVRGAFTGAERDRQGAFAAAHRGTLFLDEIGELELAAQPRLLRALERKQVKPVGAAGYVSADVRVVAATNRDLLAEVKAGRFREDLYHRLAVVRVTLLPLRERRPDIPQLVRTFLAEAGGREPPAISDDTMALLMAHEWPGNVRELRNVLERAMSLAPAAPVLDAHTFGLDETAYLRADLSSPPVDMTSPFKEAKERLVQAWEREYVVALLDRCRGNVSHAARTSGLDRVYLHRLIKKHGLAAS